MLYLVTSVITLSNVIYGGVRQSIVPPPPPSLDRVLQSTVTTWMRGKYIGLELYLGQVFAVCKLLWAIVCIRLVHGQ